MKLFIIQGQVSNSKVEVKVNLWVSNSKFNLIFYEIKLVARKKNFYKKFWVSNSKCDVISRNSVWQLDFVTQEFRTSSKFQGQHAA